MRDLIRSLRAAGDPIPVPWASLGRLVRPRRGSLATVIAAPGIGKSTVALEWLDSLDQPSLYISLDTALADQAIRFYCRRTGVEVAEAETLPPEVLQAELETVKTKVRFFDKTIRAHQVGEVIRAESEYWGEVPAMVVVDNLKNLLEKEESASEYERILSELHTAARELNTFILMLHHIGRLDKKDREKIQTKPVTMTDGVYAGERDVQYVFGLWRPKWDQLRVAVLKNRMGRSDASGSLYTTLDFQGATARVLEMDDMRQWAGAAGG